MASDQLAQELYLLGSYGLRNKRELYKAQSQLSSIRKQARHLLAAPAVERTREEGKLLTSLLKKGLLSPGMILDDVLSLSVEDMLSRRLQTVIYKRGSASPRRRHASSSSSTGTLRSGTGSSRCPDTTSRPPTSRRSCSRAASESRSSPSRR